MLWWEIFQDTTMMPIRRSTSKFYQTMSDAVLSIPERLSTQKQHCSRHQLASLSTKSDQYSSVSHVLGCCTTLCSHSAADSITVVAGLRQRLPSISVLL